MVNLSDLKLNSIRNALYIDINKKYVFNKTFVIVIIKTIYNTIESCHFIEKGNFFIL